MMAATPHNPFRVYTRVILSSIVNRGLFKLHLNKAHLSSAIVDYVVLYAFFAAIALGALLVVRANGDRQVVATAIYAAGICGLFGISALYHRVDWRRPRARAWRAPTTCGMRTPRFPSNP